MKKFVSALLLLLALTQFLNCYAFAGATKPSAINGIVIGFDDLGMPIIVSDDGKETKYFLKMNLSVKIADMQAFITDQRISVTPKAVFTSTNPIEIDPDTVRGLPLLPIYAGLVKSVDIDQNRLHVYMQDGRNVWLLLNDGADIDKYNGQGILFYLESDKKLPESRTTEAKAVWSKTLDVYRGIIDIDSIDHEFGLVTLKGDSPLNTFPEGIILTPSEQFTGIDMFSVGDYAVALFDRNHQRVYALLKNSE